MPIKLWLHLVLENIQTISDLDYQYENWVKGSNANNQDSYIETMSRLFDDADVNNFIANYAVKAGLTYLQTIELQKIIDAIDQYDGSKLTHEQLLEEPQWIKITDMAKETLQIMPKDSMDIKQ